jgi:hypothetical protein
MKTYGERMVQLHALLTPVLERGEQLHAPAALTAGKEPLLPIG